MTTVLWGGAASAGAIKVGSVTDSRFLSSWTLDGAEMLNTRAKLLNPANFGNAGKVRRTIEITDTAATADSLTLSLLSQFEVFFVGWLDDADPNAFTAWEINALKVWVFDGGTLIVTCDDLDHDAVCAAFGYPASGDYAWAPGLPAPGFADHPLFNGPFGAVPSFSFMGNYNYFATSLGATVLAVDSHPAYPAILRRAWGSGRVFLLCDVDIIANAASAGDAITTVNDRLLGNLFALAARPYDLLIDAAAHTGGVGGTTWRSDVDVLNIGNADASVSISLLKVAQANPDPTSTPVTVPAGRSLRLFDILAGLFSAGNAALGFQFPRGEVFVNSRFYNVGSADGKTYGMYIPSTSGRETVWYGRPGAFHHLSYTPGATSGSRVNIGGASRVPFPVQVLITLFGDGGELLGTRTHTFQPYEHRQFTKIHEGLGTPAVSHGHATVAVNSPGGAVDMYAMLIENNSGDPIFMPPEFSGPGDDVAAATGRRPGLEVAAATAACSGPYDRIIAAAAHTGGVGGTLWRSDVDLLNLGETAASVDIARLRANQANTAPLVANVSVPAGQTVRLPDVLDSLLPASNAGLGIRLCSGLALANSRFYNTGSADGRVYGMFVPAMALGQTVTPCRPGIFHHLDYSPDTGVGQRVNIGATNATGVATTWVIRLYSGTGGLLGTRTHTLQAYEHRQFTNVHQGLGTPAVTNGWASVEVTTPGGAIHPYAMRIENVGGDPIYMPAELLEVATSDDVVDAFEGTWFGGWVNSTFATSGGATLELAFNPDGQSVEATVNLDGNVFGGGDPAPQTLVGALAPEGIVFHGSSPALGTVSATVDGFCSITGRLTDLPNPAIARVDFSGTATPTAIAVAYTVYFSEEGGGGSAVGTLTLSK